jgi:hypothetical protein
MHATAKMAINIITKHIPEHDTPRIHNEGTQGSALVLFDELLLERKS